MHGLTSNESIAMYQAWWARSVLTSEYVSQSFTNGDIQISGKPDAVKQIEEAIEAYMLRRKDFDNIVENAFKTIDMAEEELRDFDARGGLHLTLTL